MTTATATSSEFSHLILAFPSPSPPFPLYKLHLLCSPCSVSWSNCSLMRNSVSNCVWGNIVFVSAFQQRFKCRISFHLPHTGIGLNCFVSLSDCDSTFNCVCVCVRDGLRLQSANSTDFSHCLLRKELRNCTQLRLTVLRAERMT